MKTFGNGKPSSSAAMARHAPASRPAIRRLVHGNARALANDARAAGAAEAGITEAVEVGYLYGGTAALVIGVSAFTS